MAIRLAKNLNSVEFYARYHGLATVTWILLVVPSVLWWHNSIAWVMFMSLYANVATEWGAWQAARAELRVKRDMETADAGPAPLWIAPVLDKLEEIIEKTKEV